jgi:ATP-binding cassette subfamily C (CFTR/MRP) protein 10
VRGYRSAELSALARRKYLDALCVYFWAATQLLLSGTTFGLMVLLGQPLRCDNRQEKLHVGRLPPQMA